MNYDCTPKDVGMNQEHVGLALGPYRALDLSDEKGFMCGKVLGDLGADVIKVEKPGGDSSRRIGPFYKDIPHPEKSLHWFAYNANKRGITLNLETRDGKDLFKRLVQKADFVIESFHPGYMDAIGLGYSTLSEINPGIIMVSISHFGQTGPYSSYKGSDIVDMAMSGYLYVTGDPDRPPVRISVPQAYLHGGAHAAAGIMIALYYRQLTGEGQWVDESVQQSLAKLPYDVHLFLEFNDFVTRRQGRFYERGKGPEGRKELQIWPCADGYVSFMVRGTVVMGRMGRMTEWMAEKGMADDFLMGVDWKEFDLSLMTQDFIDQIRDRIELFFLKQTMVELHEGAVKKQIMLYPVTTPKDVAENVHLDARGFWEKVKHPEINDTITYPGAFVKSTEMPISIRRRAPLIGEHNEEVYQELGLSRQQLVDLKQGGII